LKFIIKKNYPVCGAEVRNCNSVRGAKVYGAEPGSKWCGVARCGTGKTVRVSTTVYKQQMALHFTTKS